MDATARFIDLVRQPEDDIVLEEGALLVAAHAYPGLDVAEELAELDALAAGCAEPTVDGWRHHVFVELGFAGNRSDYYDPRNSFLNEVIRRRLGIPITLAIVGIAIGRRVGLSLSGVSMPGHFLLSVDDQPGTFVDPFGGDLLDAAGCEAMFRAVQGGRATWHPSHLRPVGARQILTRVLANLQAIYTSRGDQEALGWVMSLKLSIPGAPQLN